MKSTDDISGDQTKKMQNVQEAGYREIPNGMQKKQLGPGGHSNLDYVHFSHLPRHSFLQQTLCAQLVSCWQIDHPYAIY